MFIHRLQSHSTLWGLLGPPAGGRELPTLWSYKHGPPGGGPELQTVKSLRDFTLKVSGPTLNHIPPGV